MSRRMRPGQPESYVLDLDAPPVPLAPDMPLEGYARRWLIRHCAKLKYRGRETYWTNLELHILPALGPMTPLSGLTRQRIGDFLLAKLGAGYAPRTVWCMFKITRAMLTAARLDDGVLREDVTARVGRLLPKRNDQPTTDGAFRPEELDAFLAAAERLHPRLARFFVVAARTGMRLGELLALTWPDLDLEQRVVIVRRTIDWRGRANAPKGGRTADLPLSELATRALRELHDWPHRPRTAVVFASPGGRPWARSYIGRVMVRACARAGVAARSIHSLRRTFLTRLAESGANPFAIRDLARHRSITTTEGYLRLNLRYRAIVDAAERGTHAEPATGTQRERGIPR